ncbi:MAG: hypothetical protein F6K56_20235 [Moorea sp. SIO3G5]|nr:hypothetical protein [Moorena sp. SIO3G5]
MINAIVFTLAIRVGIVGILDRKFPTPYSLLPTPYSLCYYQEAMLKAPVF